MANVPDGGVVPANGWRTVRTVPNPLGLVPLVDVTNLGSVRDVCGVSELAALADLTDALTKVMLDALDHVPRIRVAAPLGDRHGRCRGRGWEPG